jgi:hypothetical protein
MRARNHWTFDDEEVNIMTSGPEFVLSLHRRKPFASRDCPGGAPACMLTISGE